MFRNLSNWCFSALMLVFFAGTFTANAQGEALFKAKCASCHQPHKNGTGPKLFQVRQKWTDGGAKEGSIYQWVNNWQTAAAGDPYAQTVSTWSPTAMSAFPELKKEEIDAIFEYVDGVPDPAAAGAGGTDGAAGDVTGADPLEEEDSNGWMWIILSVIFVTIILAVGGVRRQLNFAANEAQGKDSMDHLTYAEELKAWAWKYKTYVGVSTLVVVIGLIVTLFLGLYSIGVVENYQPSQCLLKHMLGGILRVCCIAKVFHANAKHKKAISLKQPSQPLAFPHAIHTGVNGIDCKYCHSSVEKSKSAGIPSVNVCMNCHKQVNGRTPAQQEQIAKIYDAAGWDPSGAGKYTGKSKPIVWNNTIKP